MTICCVSHTFYGVSVAQIVVGLVASYYSVYAMSLSDIIGASSRQVKKIPWNSSNPV